MTTYRVGGSARQLATDHIPPYVPPAARHAAGRSARRDVPFAAQVDLPGAEDRRDPVDVPEAQAATRVPELVPVRYGRMLVSPFTFFRGAAELVGDAARTGRIAVRGGL